MGGYAEELHKVNFSTWQYLIGSFVHEYLFIDTLIKVKEIMYHVHYISALVEFCLWYWYSGRYWHHLRMDYSVYKRR